MVIQSRINEPDHKINDLTFVNNIVLLEIDATQGQLPQDVLKHNASQVGLEINTDKTVQMGLNMND